MCNCNLAGLNTMDILCVFVGIVVVVCIVVMTIYSVMSYLKITKIEETLKRME